MRVRVAVFELVDCRQKKKIKLVDQDSWFKGHVRLIITKFLRVIFLMASGSIFL